jgi:CheY-like chemotaxis protein
MLKIIVIDDDPDLLEMVTVALTSNGLHVIPLSSGAKVIETIQFSMPDVVLMDIFLGSSDGRSLCKIIKTTPGIASIPVILYSAGYITNYSVTESLANHFLRKPFDIPVLITTIHKQVQQN